MPTRRIVGYGNQGSGYGSTHDHGSLTGLGDDDHAIYLRNDQDGEIQGGLTLNDSLLLEGDATVWEDMRFPAALQAKKGAPSLTAYKGGQVLALDDNNDQGIYFNPQTPHSRKLLSTVEVHAHYAMPTAGANGGVENLKFDFTYSWAGIGDVFPAESSLTVTIDIQTFAADTHFLVNLGNLTGPVTDTISGMMICSFNRDNSVANDYADDIYLLEVDFHIEKDSLGSNEEYVK